MKKLISNNGGYKLFVEVIQPVRDTGYKQLRFSTQYENSDDPTDFHTKFEFMVNEEEIQRLKEVL